MDFSMNLIVFLVANNFTQYCQIIFPEAHIYIDNVPFSKSFCCLSPSLKILLNKGLICTHSFTVPGMHYLINPHNYLLIQSCDLA